MLRLRAAAAADARPILTEAVEEQLCDAIMARAAAKNNEDGSGVGSGTRSTHSDASRDVLHPRDGAAARDGGGGKGGECAGGGGEGEGGGGGGGGGVGGGGLGGGGVGGGDEGGGGGSGGESGIRSTLRDRSRDVFHSRDGAAARDGDDGSGGGSGTRSTPSDGSGDVLHPRDTARLACVKAALLSRHGLIAERAVRCLTGDSRAAKNVSQAEHTLTPSGRGAKAGADIAVTAISVPAVSGVPAEETWDRGRAPPADAELALLLLRRGLLGRLARCAYWAELAPFVAGLEGEASLEKVTSVIILLVPLLLVNMLVY